MITIKRALLSCHDKSGLEAFAKRLAGLGVELVASGGTAEFLRAHGLSVASVEEFAGIAEQLDGRVKTLHPKIHAGILARRGDPAHMQAVGPAGLIDLVVVNLYPFEHTIQQAGVSLAQAVEQIDIGGVALLRAAAKNFSGVAAVCQPQQYPMVADALANGQGRLEEALAQQLAVRAFQLTSAYDTWISGYLAAENGLPTPGVMTVTVRKRQSLRYGENPHQHGGWYVPDAGPVWGLGTLTQLQGKELSYNNLLDLDAALRCLLEFDEAPTCTIIKHHSQCGLASAADVHEAYRRAHACDAESAFGSIVGFNRPVDRALAEALTATFLEIVAAPAVEASARAVFERKANLRVVTLEWPTHRPESLEWRQLLGGWLIQDTDDTTLDPRTLKVVTARAPSDAERADLLFAWKAAKHALSNGIVLAHAQATVGIGQGQPSRVGAVRMALEKAGPRSRGAVAASDGFFPFPDTIDLLAKAGVTAVIQPGGSLKDPAVLEAADRAKLAMLLTGVRHFRH